MRFVETTIPLFYATIRRLASRAESPAQVGRPVPYFPRSAPEEAALRTTERFQISYWDAAIIEAARALGCREVLSEDLSHGQDYGGVRVVNPFRTT